MRTKILLAALAAGLCGAPAAEAAYVAILDETPGGVIERDSGSLDLTDLTPGPVEGIFPSRIDPGAGLMISAFPGGLVSSFQGDIEGPASFGDGGSTLASESSNISDPTGIAGAAGILYVPFGATPGEAFNVGGTSFYAGATLASLGLTRGTYVWNWGSGDHADTFTLVVTTPEPSTWEMMLIGFAGLGYAGYRRAREPRAA